MTINDYLRVTKNPFSKRSSEQETDFLNSIFFEPNYYQTLKDDLLNGDSRFITGQRGHGKSSIINKLFNDLSTKNILTVIIDRYDEIPVKKNETAFLKLILKLLVTKLGVYLYSNKAAKKKLSSNEIQKLTLFLQMFFNSLSPAEYSQICNSINNIKVKNFFIKAFNLVGVKIFNTVATITVNLTSDLISKSLGAEGAQNKDVYKEYIGELPIYKMDSIKIDEIGKEQLKKILDDLLEMIEKVGFQKTVILFDKIDEYQELSQDVEKIGLFTQEILTDTELLLNNKISFGFSLWSELKNELSGSVRFDKFDSIDVSWKSADLESIINKRLKYFSSSNTAVTLEYLIKDPNDKKDVLDLANSSPRDLISSLASVYQEQANANLSLDFFSRESISKGLLNFCMNYDYDSQFSSKVGRNKEIKSMINKLLSVKNNRFTIKVLSETLNQNNGQSDGQIKLMKKYRLIREEDILMDQNKSFEVIDPKLLFMLKRSVSRLD